MSKRPNIAPLPLTKRDKKKQLLIKLLKVLSIAVVK